MLFVIRRNKCGRRTILNIYTNVCARIPCTRLFFKQAFFAALVAFKLESFVLCVHVCVCFHVHNNLHLFPIAKTFISL